MSHIRRSQFQQGIIQEIIQQFGPVQIVLFEPPGEIGLPKRRVLAIKQSIKELQHLTYFTNFIIVHRVQYSQCSNLQGRWIQATYAINAAIPRELCEDKWVCSTQTEGTQALDGMVPAPAAKIGI